MRSKIALFLILFTVALGAAGFWFWQKNVFSPGSLRLEIIAPDNITMGEEITYIVQWKNNGEAELDLGEVKKLQSASKLRGTLAL